MMSEESKTGRIISFDDFELDLITFELRKAGSVVHVEPKVFDLIARLSGNPGQVLSRDVLIEQIWDGRFVSDATVSSAVSAARRALGDNGEEKKYIQTVRGRGFRFAVNSRQANEPTANALELGPPKDLRPAIIVLPFTDLSSSQEHAVLAVALAHDIIQALSRLRWLRVIARGTAFRFRAESVELDTLRTSLDARYCLSGVIELNTGNLRLTFELIDLNDQTQIWSDQIAGRIDQIHDMRNEVVKQTVSCVEVHIPLHEARLARMMAPENLDAWSAFHLGITQMYRFNAESMQAAAGYFEHAIKLEPTFARAHAGMSFAQFQLAFNEYPGADKAVATRNAFASAERGLELDPFDPLCNFTQGRAFWLTGELDRSLSWLQRSTELSPNFAQGHYATAFASALTNRTKQVFGAVDTASSLSPLDPLLWAFHCVRSFACIADGNFAEAREWANAAASTHGALVVIDMTAVIANHLDGDARSAEQWASQVRSRKPDADTNYFFNSLSFQDPKTRQVMAGALAQYGF